jgi:hypothetical protein
MLRKVKKLAPVSSKPNLPPLIMSYGKARRFMGPFLFYENKKIGPNT